MTNPPPALQFESRSGSDVVAPAFLAARAREIPYDYVARFTLEGNAGNRLQDVINVSVEGSFVAVALGYSVLPPPRDPPALPPGPPPAPQPALMRGRQRAANALALINQAFLDAAAAPLNRSSSRAFIQRLRVGIAPAAGVVPRPPMLTDDDVRALIDCTIHRRCGIDFLYSVIDSGSGRELQNQPIHNLAGLGSADGIRPFRPLAKPMIFAPRSTIRIEIIEQSQSDALAGASLYFVLHGYKVLGHDPT